MRQQGSSLRRCVAVISVLCVAALVYAAVEPAQLDQCPDCKGKKLIPCPQCKYGKIKVDCPECQGTGRTACTAGGCMNGKTTCPACRGTGNKKVVDRYEEYRDGKILRKRPVYKFVPCPSQVDCATCRGKGSLQCGLCSGYKKKTDRCPECSGAGKVKCVRCNGTGYLAPLPPREPHPDDLPEQSDDGQLAVSLRKSLGVIKECDATAEPLATAMDAIRERHAKVSAIVEAAGDDSARQSALDDAYRSWLDVDEKFKNLSPAFDSLESMRKESGTRAREIQDLLGRLHAEGQRISGKSVQEYEDYAKAYKAARDKVDRDVTNLRSQLDNVQSRIQRQQEKQAELAREREQKEKLVQAYAQIEKAVTESAKHAGLPEFSMKLVDRHTQSSNELRVEIAYLDNDARDAEDTAQIEPSEAYLEKIPQFVNSVLGTHTEVKSIKLCVQANHLSRTGIRRPTKIQSFSFVRSSEWTELMVGEFKDDWQKILSACNPDPSYPRRASLFGESALLYLFVGLMVCAVFVLVLVRFQILRRF